MTNQTKASCVYFILCSGEVPAPHTTDVREGIGTHSYRNHAVVQTTRSAASAPLLPSAALTSAPSSCLYLSCRHFLAAAGNWSLQIPPAQRAVPRGTSSARVCTGECWLPKHARGRWPMEARPTDTRVQSDG